MHIVLANQWFPPESAWGGVGMWNWTMSRAYRDLGHQVTVIAARTSKEIPSEHETDGICVRRLLVSDAYRWRRLPVVGRYVRPIQQLAYARRVDHALRVLNGEQPIDVVEFAEINAEAFFYVRAPQAAVVVRCHTPTFVLKRYYQPAERPYDTRLISWCERVVIRRAHALTAPSHDMARVIALETQLPLDSITPIPNALAAADFDRNGAPVEPRDHVLILHVGRLEHAKGIDTLVRAIPLVLAKLPSARFVFVGADRSKPDGSSQRADLERILEKDGVLSAVDFLGEIDQTTLQAWYRRADLCVVPSMLYESFSYTCAQAMAAGKPVVASRIGGIPETVEDRKTGLIVEPGSIDQLADAISLIACDPELRKQMGHAGREKARRDFDPLRIAERNLEVYAQARRVFGAKSG